MNIALVGAEIEEDLSIRFEDLDSLPFLARDFKPHLHVGIPTATMAGSRGCYGSCSFCCIYAWHKASGGRKYRARSIENLVKKMAELYYKRGIRIFIFHDDNFFLPMVKDNFARVSKITKLREKEGPDNVGLVVKARPDNVHRDLMFYTNAGLPMDHYGCEVFHCEI